MDIVVRPGDSIIVEGLPRKVTIAINDSRASIAVEGYKYPDKDSLEIAWIDFFGMEGCGLSGLMEGGEYESLEEHKHPRVLVWADINNDEPTHSISLGEAAEENWKPEAEGEAICPS